MHSGEKRGIIPNAPAGVMELVDVLDSKSSAARRAGSSPATGTTSPQASYRLRRLFFKSHRSLILLRLLSPRKLKGAFVGAPFGRSSAPDSDFAHLLQLEMPGFPVLGSRVFHALFAGSLLQFSPVHSNFQRPGRIPGEMLKDSFIRAAEVFLELVSR